MRKEMLVAIILCVFVFPTEVLGQKKVPILVYHSIDVYSGHGSKELYVTPDNFEKQMSYLKNHGYTLLTFERWKDIKHVKKPVFITFDDGYKNNTNADMIFQKLKNEQFKPAGTLFVISDFIGRSNRLSKMDLIKMANSGMFSIQSHTSTHPDLTKAKNLEYELKDSKEKIEQITGKPVIALAYPYGKYNKRVIEDTKKYYSFGLTTTPEVFIEKGVANENYLLPRIYVKNSTTLKDFAKLLE
ncbi:polysaccharide deacetylase family protein [Heyndrickxia sporothermodurans]|uniref:polysaccharide deacetylase family protein n=1 Tax=Heyndrickxia sporothermodurans TaxID=46224 RepID=UPI00192BBC4C|nr:polysaccharide deacetylase family protein [Heyndrickxia sporothermodurans]MBL5886798.1 polysaccharide deacetylase family protein [Heyndrickxia sporothermodurans]MBL5893814.1 polysaccharide deacetylase family protein [Heyndrickxia sporothermodurans]